MVAVGIGGFVVGFIEKSFPNLPTLPMVGRKGAIAIGLAMFGPKTGILADAAVAAAAIAGYELGKTGAISGDVLGMVSPQVSGLAAQV